MRSKYFPLTCYGALLTYVGTFIIFFFAPAPLPSSMQWWHIGTCIAVTLIVVATYFGYPRDLARPPSLGARVFALLTMVVTGSLWLWLLYRTVFAEDNQELTINIQRTAALLLFATGYYVFTQKPSNTE